MNALHITVYSSIYVLCLIYVCLYMHTYLWMHINIYIHMHEDMYIHTPDMYVIMYVQTRCAPWSTDVVVATYPHNFARSAAPPATCAGDLMDLQAFCAAQEQKMKTVRRSLEMLGLWLEDGPKTGCFDWFLPPRTGCLGACMAVAQSNLTQEAS